MGMPEITIGDPKCEPFGELAIVVDTSRTSTVVARELLGRQDVVFTDSSRRACPTAQSQRRASATL